MEAAMPPLRTRAAIPDDAGLAVRWMVSDWSLPARYAPTLQVLFEGLLEAELVRGGCIEEFHDGEGWVVKAIGLSAFVADCFIASYLAAPAPFPSLLLLQMALDGDASQLCGRECIGRANASAAGPLNQLTVYYGQVVKNPADPAWRRILPASHKMHRDVHSGFRMQRLLQDEWTLNEPVFLFAGYKLLQRFPTGSACPLGRPPLADERSLVSLTAADAAQQLPGSTASFLFEYRRPKLALSDTQQRLLTAACSGHTDADIARRLALSPNTLKTAWRSVYQKFDRRLPFVLGDVSEDAEGRGPEKRRRVTAYVQDHPEELRPFAW